MDDEVGYRGAVAARAAGITYRQLDYWARTELVVPTVRGASGSGSQRLYGFRDILVLKLVKELLDTGISLQQIRTAVDQLRAAGIRDLAGTTLMSDGASVYLCTSNDEVIDLVSRGQGVFGIAVGKVLHEVEATLVEFDAAGAGPMDELAARRARVRLTAPRRREPAPRGPALVVSGAPRRSGAGVLRRAMRPVRMTRSSSVSKSAASSCAESPGQMCSGFAAPCACCSDVRSGSWGESTSGRTCRAAP
jgi:DNA-binding transcriptional MerR regulator